eukprot:905984-Pleurochrysis_carterae.AAC.2
MSRPLRARVRKLTRAVSAHLLFLVLSRLWLGRVGASSNLKDARREVAPVLGVEHLLGRLGLVLLIAHDGWCLALLSLKLIVRLEFPGGHQHRRSRDTRDLRAKQRRLGARKRRETVHRGVEVAGQVLLDGGACDHLLRQHVWETRKSGGGAVGHEVDVRVEAGAWRLGRNAVSDVGRWRWGYFSVGTLDHVVVLLSTQDLKARIAGRSISVPKSKEMHQQGQISRQAAA